MAHGKLTHLPGRREVLRILGMATAYAALPACGSSTTQPPSYFTDDERTALGVLADVVLPPDARGPGGKDLGAVEFVERLLTAFDVDPPAIWAGGPYSGRQPFAAPDGSPSTNFPPNDAAHFLPLDRAAERSWRLAIYGSDAVGGAPNDAIVGKEPGLRAVVKKALADAVRFSPGPMAQLSPADAKSVFASLDDDAQDTLVELVSQAAFSFPEYGGNKNLAGWKMVHYEGDSQPYGYSPWSATTGAHVERPDAPLSGPNPGVDPDPLDDDTRSFLTTLIGALGGKVF